MKSKGIAVKAAFFAVSVLMIGFIGNKAYSRIVTNVAPDFSSSEVRAVVFEDFESSPAWTVQSVPKQFQNSDAEKTKKKNPVPVLEIKIIDGAPSDMVVEQWTPDKKGMQKNKCLGAHFQFRYPGFNSVHLLPPQPLMLPGRSKGISIWVHGRGKNYTLEAWVKDYKGNTHILKFFDEEGKYSVNFVGWKPLKAFIPTYVPQEITSYPQTKGVSLERLVLRSDPSEDTEPVYFFFDQLKVLTETFEVNFDGQGLEKAFEGGSSQNQPAPASANQ